jgi:lipopolysaccharide/colanic/teichoic acid biosynthesis glycosyltransferase
VPLTAGKAIRCVLFELVVSLAAFALVAVFVLTSHPEFLPDDLIAAAVVFGTAYWWGFEWGAPAPGSGTMLQGVIVGTGLVLVVQSLANYADLIFQFPFWPAMGGCVVAAGLTVAARAWMLSRWKRGKVLLLGFGPFGPAAVRLLGTALAGVIDTAPAGLPAGVAYLGGYGALESQIHAPEPVVGMLAGSADWQEHVSARFLLECKLQGIALETVGTLQERLLERLPVEALRPSDFLWSEPLRANRRIMAVQAVYSNLIGLMLLVAVSPLLVVVGLAARIAAGPGPVFEKVECSGFQGIPFFRRRFRTQHVSSGEFTAIGRLLIKLRLTGLPQLINLVRGEMALVGPQPVRTVFAEYLDRLSPLYSRRLLVKPGIFGWAQANGGRDPAPPGSFAENLQEEHLRIAYDLYYLQFGSPLLDLEILGRTLLGPGRARKRP